MKAKFLTALPVYNEVKYVDGVLNEVLRYSPDVLVVDDGSTDGTSELLAQRKDIRLVRHDQNRGYGAALKSAFEYTLQHGFDTLVTIDCDGQHEPQRIPHFVAAAAHADVVSGSRYLKQFSGDSLPPTDRRAINHRITQEINRRLGFSLTDAFCGFKAYRAKALEAFDISETGYAMPLEVWVQIAAAGLNVQELAVPLIYLDASRSFGGSLDNAEIRLKHYYDVIERAIAAQPSWPTGHALSRPVRGERAG